LSATCAAHAQTRAWLDRDQVALGETATLNIETDQATTASPDYTPLQGDFSVSGNTSSRQVEIVNGRTSARMLFAVALQPRREGLLTVPALQVGAQSTQPLSLAVTAAAPPARAGSAAFIESEADDQNPYVQQAVGFTLRLYYDAATPVVSGQLDQDAPDGASLQRIGSDQQYMRDVSGRRYTVVERHFLLIPERSGPVTIPGARFQGHGAGGFFDDVFGDGQRDLAASAAPRFLTVRPAPVDAPQPWLPLRGLTLRYIDAPRDARAGEAATVTVEATADGATAAQMPELRLPAVAGVQVFADPPQAEEGFDHGRPQVKLTRRFSLVPAHAGALRIPGPRMGWWDVRAATARIASLPDLALQVAPAAAGAGNASSPRSDDANADASTDADADADASSAPVSHFPGMRTASWPWALAAVFALLWLGTLAWALRRRNAATITGRMRHGEGVPQADSPLPPAANLRMLKQALDTGDLGDVADALCTLARPPAATLDMVRARLADAAQRDAVAQLQRARWGDGDAVAARGVLRAAFAAGPRWIAAEPAPASPLPPLYPGDERGG
jgi:hypothetical protein